MITINLYQIKKRLNSTRVPTLPGTPVLGELKQDFTLTGMTVRFQFSSPDDVPAYNYAYIPTLSRYYFITDWYYTRGFWNAALAVDVLASNRDDILNSTQYVARSTSHFDSALIDTAYPATGAAQHDSKGLSPASFWGADASGNNGTIVLGVICSDSDSIGAVTYYAMSMATFSSFMATMLSSINWAGISTSEISTELQKALINPTQYIVSCTWYPFIPSSLTGLTIVTSVKLGWWSFSPSGTVYQITTPLQSVVSRTQEIEIPKHPRGVGRRSYLQLSPYSVYTLKFPPFGVFELDSTELFNRDFLRVNVETSLLTGDCTIKITAYAFGEEYNMRNAFFYYTARLGVPLTVGQIAGDVNNWKNALVAGTVSGVAEALGGAF